VKKVEPQVADEMDDRLVSNSTLVKYFWYVLVVALVMCLLLVCFSGSPGDVFTFGMF
jgi:hypothetical protein